MLANVVAALAKPEWVQEGFPPAAARRGAALR